MLTLRQLTYFDQLAKTGHFGRAALEASISQPALSMQIKELEAHLGLILVERYSGGARLTEEGREVLARTRIILSAIQDLEAYGKSRKGPLEGTFRLGVIPSVGPYLLPDILPALRRDYPQLELILRETRTENLLSELSDAQLDAAILALPVEEGDFGAMPLFEDPFLLATPKSDAPVEPVRADGIDMSNLLLLEEGHCLRDQALQACTLARNPLMQSFGASSLTTLIQLIANGYGTTLLPRMCVQKEALVSQLTLIPFTDPVPSRTIGLIWRKTSARHADFAALGTLIQTAKEV
jgi:LysR family transcriptional regulator, hydrogen peroxide-inducible genes activator